MIWQRNLLIMSSFMITQTVSSSGILRPGIRIATRALYRNPLMKRSALAMRHYHSFNSHPPSGLTERNVIGGITAGSLGFATVVASGFNGLLIAEAIDQKMQNKPFDSGKILENAKTSLEKNSFLKSLFVKMPAGAGLVTAYSFGGPISAASFALFAAGAVGLYDQYRKSK